MTVLPDVYGAVIDYVAGSIPTATVAADLNGFEAGDKWVEIKEPPGGREIVEGRHYTTVFDFNCYDSTIEAARSLAMVAHSVAKGMKNYTDSDLVVTRVQTDTTPYNLTDLTNNQPRYIFTVTVFYRTN